MSKSEKAFAGPLLVFLAFLAGVELIHKLFEDSESLWLSSPQYWIFPIQTVVCAGLLWKHWNFYPLAIQRWAWSIGLGVLVFLIWISPQEVFHVARRYEGFDPMAVGPNPFLIGASLTFRILRLVLVVPLVEEIFWRGYLLRYLIDHDFEKVKVGTFSWLSFAVVTLAFMLVHSPADYPAAAITGALYNLVAYKTRSIGSCVLAHAVTNAILGAYILLTGQWGFW